MRISCCEYPEDYIELENNPLATQRIGITIHEEETGIDGEPENLCVGLSLDKAQKLVDALQDMINEKKENLK